MATIDHTPNQIEPYPNIRVGCTDIFKSAWKGSYIRTPLDAFMWECSTKAYRLYFDNRLESIKPAPVIYVLLSEDYSYSRGGRAFFISVKTEGTGLRFDQLFSLEEFDGYGGDRFENTLLDNIFSNFTASIINSNIYDRL